MSIIVTADSSCDLPNQFLHPVPFDLIPLTVVQSGIEYKDGIDISPEQIYERVAGGAPVPTTSAINISDYYERFRRLSQLHDAVIHISLGSEISSCYNHAKLAATEFSNVYIVDSQNISLGQGILALQAKAMIEAGAAPRAIADALNDLANKVEFHFILDQVTYLHKGGRCSSIAALGANLLKLKPSIAVQKGGRLAMIKKYRGAIEKVLPLFIGDHLNGRNDILPEKIMLVTTHCPPHWTEIAQSEIKRCTGQEIHDSFYAGCTICSHSGPKALGFAVLKK